MSEQFNNVWDAIEDTQHEAANLKIRSPLLIALQEHLKSTKITQTQAAKLLKVTQSRISDLMRGSIALFSLESLIDMITNAGFEVEMKVKDAA